MPNRNIVIDSYEKIEIVTPEGVSLKPAEIPFNNIISVFESKDKEVIKLVVSSNSVSGKVDSVSYENDYYTFDSQELVDTMQFISDLKWKHNIFGENSLIDLDEYYKQFAIGNVGMILAAGSFTSSIYKYEMPLEKIGIMAIPEGPAKHVTLTGGYCATVADGATEDQIDVAIKWLEKDGKTFKLSEESKKASEEGYKQMVKDNMAIGIRTLPLFKNNAEIEQFITEMIDKYGNIDLNHVKLYNDSLSDKSIELRPEEPVYAQELYAALDGIIQEVLTNKDADIKALIKKAQEDFQNNYLNNAF